MWALCVQRLRQGLRHVLAVSQLGNGYMQANKPWALMKRSDEDKWVGKKRDSCIHLLAVCLSLLLTLLLKFLPFLDWRAAWLPACVLPTWLTAMPWFVAGEFHCADRICVLGGVYAHSTVQIITCLFSHTSAELELAVSSTCVYSLFVSWLWWFTLTCHRLLKRFVCRSRWVSFLMLLLVIFLPNSEWTHWQSMMYMYWNPAVLVWSCANVFSVSTRCLLC